MNQPHLTLSVNIKTIGSGADPLTVAKRSIKEYLLSKKTYEVNLIANSRFL